MRNRRRSLNLKKTRSTNTRNHMRHSNRDTRPNTPLRSSPTLISSRVAHKRHRTHSLIKTSRQRRLKRSAPKISSSF